ncbi:MAG: hypothetical protein ACKOJF_36035, partial [Planctomycetaceae bacterium]
EGLPFAYGLTAPENQAAFEAEAVLFISERELGPHAGLVQAGAITLGALLPQRLFTGSQPPAARW